MRENGLNLGIPWLKSLRNSPVILISIFMSKEAQRKCEPCAYGANLLALARHRAPTINRPTMGCHQVPTDVLLVRFLPVQRITFGEISAGSADYFW